MILTWVLIAVLILTALFVLAGAEPWNRCRARLYLAGRPRLDSRAFGMQFYPDNPEVAARVRDLLQEFITVDISQIQPSDQPVRDFYLGVIYGEETDDFFGAIERSFYIQLEEEVVAEIITVNDLISYVILRVEGEG